MNEVDDESNTFLSSKPNVRRMQTGDVSLFLRKRYFVCFWTCMGLMLHYIFRTSLSIALVELTSEKNVTTENGLITRGPEYDWDSKQKGFILSLFSYGCFFTPVGGILGVRYGGVRIFGLGIFLTALLNLLTPYLLGLNFSIFAAARVLEGVSESLTDASFLNIFIKWAPPHEKSRLVVFAFAGMYAGTSINYVLCGFLAHNYGVNSIFYVTGGTGLIWYGVWLLFVSNEPSSDRFITSQERNYLENVAPNIDISSRKFTNYPWKTIFTSKPVWAIFNEYFCFSWLTSFIVFCLPLYIKDTFNVNVESIGLISGAPVLGNLIGVIVSAFISDHLRRHRILSIPTIHKLFVAVGQLTSASFLLIISWWANFSQSIILFTIMRTLSGSAEVTYHVALLDMFSEYTSIIKGLASCFFNLAMLLNPTVMGFMVQDHSRSSWNLYFSFLSLFNIFSMIIFYFYGSGELQEWAATEKPEEEDNKESPIQMKSI